METPKRHHFKTDVLEGALNSAVDKGLVLAQTHKVSEGIIMCSITIMFCWDIRKPWRP